MSTQFATRDTIFAPMSLEPISAPEVTRVAPVFRWAILVKHKPMPTAAHAQKVYLAIRAAWPEWKEVYRAKVAEIAGLRPDELAFAEDEEVRLKWDGDTPMIDLPRLHTTPGASKQFDVRSCVALCVKDFSSKIWCRLGRPAGSAEHFCAVTDLASCVETFRGWARRIDDWFYDEFFRLAESALDGIRNERGAAMEVTTVGLQVEAEHGDGNFEEWLLDDGKGPNLENKALCAFLADAAGFNLNPNDLPAREPDSFWLVIPTAVQQQSGVLAYRKVLYLVRHIDDVAQVVGIGLDDSKSGDLAGLAALKVSRLVAGIS